MEELKAVVASNLIRLRTGAGMTQADLGAQLNYSDKTVSKWERAESLPDAYVLKQIGAIFGVSVDALLSESETWKPEKEIRREERTVTYDTRAIMLVSLAGIWTLALLAFVVLWRTGIVLWVIFPCAIPVSLITYLVMHSVWRRGQYNVYIVMGLVFSIVLLVYLFLLKYNFWQLFLVLVPAEIVVWFSFRIRVRKAADEGGRIRIHRKKPKNP